MVGGRPAFGDRGDFRFAPSIERRILQNLRYQAHFIRIEEAVALRSTALPTLLIPLRQDVAGELPERH